jgi:hypothetical protein
MSCLVIERPPERYDFGGVRIHPLLRKLGYLGIDSTAMTLDAHHVPEDAPLGGVRDSGWGGESGTEAMRSFTETNAVWVDPEGQTRDPFRMA